jgi:hypothetical protein
VQRGVKYALPVGAVVRNLERSAEFRADSDQA